MLLAQYQLKQASCQLHDKQIHLCILLCPDKGHIIMMQGKTEDKQHDYMIGTNYHGLGEKSLWPRRGNMPVRPKKSV